MAHINCINCSPLNTSKWFFKSVRVFGYPLLQRASGPANYACFTTFHPGSCTKSTMSNAREQVTRTCECVWPGSNVPQPSSRNIRHQHISNTTCLGCILVCAPTLDSNNQQDHAFHFCLKRDTFWMSTAFKSKVSSKKHVVTWKTLRIRIKPMLAHACGT